MDGLIYQKLCDITGPYREYSPVANHIIYGSYHFKQFNKTHAWRNTLIRFDEFLVPQKLTGKTVYDLGSCLGALSFESVRRDASKVIGFEYNSDRVDVSNQLAKYLQVDDKLCFVKTDLDHQSNDEFISKYGCADTVFCCALDAYINKEKLYQLVAAITRDICYFETNSQIPPDQFKEIMTKLGFNLIIELGSSRSDVNPTRQLYLLQKKVTILNQKRSVKAEVNGHLTYVDSDIYRLDDYVVSLYIKDIYDHIKKIYDKIRDIKYAPKMLFYNPYIITPFYTNKLAEYQATTEEKQVIKCQLIDFIRQLNQKGLAHRDLHIKNAYFHEGLLRILDWEVSCDSVCDLLNCYDITGYGELGYAYHLPGRTRILRSTTFLLQDNPYSFWSYLEKNLTLADFIN